MYGKVGTDKKQGQEIDSRVFFRKNMSTDDLFELAKQDFDKASDDADMYEVQLDLLGELDQPNGGCGGESCDAFADEAA